MLARAAWARQIAARRRIFLYRTRLQAENALPLSEAACSTGVFNSCLRTQAEGETFRLPLRGVPINGI